MHGNVGNKHSIKHGMSNSPEYGIWKQMKYRCTVPSNPGFADYGEKGIRVCDEWLESFENFYNDMGNKPEGMSLDRIDVKGDYCKENCRWADISTQNYNQGIRINNRSGKTGVSWDNDRSKWFVRICIDGENVALGRFSNYEDAVKVREEAELEYYGVTKK